MVPGHRFRACSAWFAFQSCFLSRHAAPLLSFGLFCLWMAWLPGFDPLGGCSDRGGGGTAEAEEMGPVRDHWLAVPGSGERRAADGYPRTTCKVSTSHGNNGGVRERAPATTGAFCVSRVDRVCHGFSGDSGDSVVAHYAEARVLVCCGGVGAAVGFFRRASLLTGGE